MSILRLGGHLSMVRIWIVRGSKNTITSSCLPKQQQDREILIQLYSACRLIDHR